MDKRITQSAETRRNLHTHTHTHTCSLLLSFLSIILISAPAFSYVTDSSQCDNDVLSTYTGPANLTANWQGNNISVTWYNGDTQYDSNSCTYGGNLTMPSNIPTREGYTFKGWRARQASNSNSNSEQIPSLSNVDIEENAEDTSFISHYGWENADLGGPSLSQDGTWGAAFNYGTVIGDAMCSYVSEESSEPTDDYSGENCWCRVSEYIASDENSYDVSSLPWVMLTDLGDQCRYSCAQNCAEAVENNSVFRTVLYGGTISQ